MLGLPLVKSPALRLERDMSTGLAGVDLLGEGEDMVVVEEQEAEPDRMNAGTTLHAPTVGSKRQRFDSSRVWSVVLSKGTYVEHRVTRQR